MKSVEQRLRIFNTKTLRHNPTPIRLGKTVERVGEDREAEQHFYQDKKIELGLVQFLI